MAGYLPIGDSGRSNDTTTVSGLERQWQTRLLRRVTAQAGKELPRAFGVLPRTAIKPIVVATGARGHPHLVQRLLQIDHDLAAVGERQGNHTAGALGIDISICGVIDQVTAALDAQQQFLGVVHEFDVGHTICRC